MASLLKCVLNGHHRFFSGFTTPNWPKCSTKIAHGLQTTAEPKNKLGPRDDDLHEDDHGPETKASVVAMSASACPACNRTKPLLLFVKVFLEYFFFWLLAITCYHRKSGIFRLFSPSRRETSSVSLGHTSYMLHVRYQDVWILSKFG